MVRFLTNVPLPANLSGLSHAELEALLVELFGEVAALKQVAGEQREEIDRLKGLKGLPTLEPSGMDQGTGPPKPSKHGFCTQIGNDWFTWFGTCASKSRLNFLDLLRAGHTDYVLNDAAYSYMRKHDLSAALIPA